MNRTGADSLAAVGLLLTIVEVIGSGFDFANDTLGFALVAFACATLRHRAGVAGSWWTTTGCVATAAALVSLVAYGGPMGVLLPNGFLLWTGLAYLQMTVATLTFAGVALGIAPGIADQRSWMRLLPLVVLLLVVLTLVHLLLVVTGDGYVGTLGYLRQLVSVVVGLLQGLVVVAAFLAAAGASASEEPPT